MGARQGEAKAPAGTAIPLRGYKIENVMGKPSPRERKAYHMALLCRASQPGKPGELRSGLTA